MTRLWLHTKLAGTWSMCGKFRYFECVLWESPRSQMFKLTNKIFIGWTAKLHLLQANDFSFYSAPSITSLSYFCNFYFPKKSKVVKHYCATHHRGLCMFTLKAEEIHRNWNVLLFTEISHDKMIVHSLCSSKRFSVYLFCNKNVI